jgi:hypothetical protein
MQLAFLLAVAIGFSSLHQTGHDPVDCSQRRLLLAVLVGSIPLLVAAWLAALFRHGAARVPAFRWLRWSEQILACVYLTATILLFLWIDLGRFARDHWRLDRVFAADELVVMAALLVPLLPGWRALLHAQAGQADCGGEMRWWPQLRSLMMIAMFPVLAICLLADGTRLWFPASLREYRESLLAMSLPALLAAAPWYLRYAWAGGGVGSGGAAECD